MPERVGVVNIGAIRTFVKVGRTRVRMIFTAVRIVSTAVEIVSTLVRIARTFVGGGFTGVRIAFAEV